MEKVEILGVKIDNLTMGEALQKAEQMMEDGRQHYIVTPNPLFLVEAQKDEKFKKILNAADLAAADGIGLIFASWFLGRPIKQRIIGADLMEKICQLASRKKWPVFLLGGKKGIAEKAAENLKKRYLRLDISRTENYVGGRDSNINVGVPTSNMNRILFVAFGAPKQEKWISENLKKMPQVKLAMGVGGAFDFWAGRIKRAPKIFRILGLEWFWRLILQPWRIKRVFKSVVIFPYLVLGSMLESRPPTSPT